MPKASAKTKGGDKDSATKHQMNPSSTGNSGPTNEPNEQDPKRRIGQFSGTGEPPLMKK